MPFPHRRAAAPALAALLALAAAAAHASPFGVWKTETSDEGAFLHVEIRACDSDAAKVCGFIVDGENLTDRSIIGRAIIMGMEPDGADAWSGGTIWAADEDKTYRSKMSLEGGVLRVSGCVLGGLVCRGQDWTRAK